MADNVNHSLAELSWLLTNHYSVGLQWQTAVTSGQLATISVKADIERMAPPGLTGLPPSVKVQVAFAGNDTLNACSSPSYN